MRRLVHRQLDADAPFGQDGPGREAAVGAALALDRIEGVEGVEGMVAMFADTDGSDGTNANDLVIIGIR